MTREPHEPMMVGLESTIQGASASAGVLRMAKPCTHVLNPLQFCKRKKEKNRPGC